MRPPEALSGAERDARIEQLLLSGLDHYFAHNYEQAINLWTRVLFLDRTHDRARAYIDRARSAQAERQREAEAMLHQGMAAFDSGDVDRARKLLGDALDRGASRDLALGVLDRIERLESGHAAPKRRQTPTSWTSREHDVDVEVLPTKPRRARGWVAVVLLVIAGAGALAVGVWGAALPDPSTWSIFAAATGQSAPPVVPIAAEPLPVPAATETFLARAQSLFTSGRLRDAMRELERIPLGDLLHDDAQRLRAEIQRELLALAAAEQGSSLSPSPPPAPVRPPE